LFKSLWAKLSNSPVLVAMSRWIDTHVESDPNAPHNPDDDKVDWVRVIPFFAVHAVCLGVIWVGFSWVALAVCVGLYIVRMFAITGFYHRYFSHKSYQTSRAGQFVFALIGNSSMQRGPLWWAASHRHHHQHSDKDTDKHSPKHHGFLYSHMLWILTKTNFRTNMKAVPDLAKFPELVFLDRFDTLAPIALAFSMFGLGAGLNYLWPELGTSGLQMLIWGFFVSTIALFHGTCTINSLSHLFGTRRFQTTDESKNNWWLAIITLGEGWHNNHHRYAKSTRQGFYWWEYDITYYGLVVLSWFGIVWDLQPVPAHILEEGREGSEAFAAGE
jgi:stearoyl-CoA desaturase (Delta-9 desaturase)